MHVKVMGPENRGDDDSTKTFRLYERVATIEFDRDHPVNGCPQVHMEMAAGGSISVPATGNVYVMNDDGKTIASFGAAWLRKLDEPGEAA